MYDIEDTVVYNKMSEATIGSSSETNGTLSGALYYYIIYYILTDTLYQGLGRMALCRKVAISDTFLALLESLHR